MNKKIIISLVFIFFNMSFLSKLSPAFAIIEEGDGGVAGGDGGNNDSSGSNFDTDQYRTYDTRAYDKDGDLEYGFDDRFYISPIRNVLEGNAPELPEESTKTSAEKQYMGLITELSYTGYEAHCLAEEVEIKPGYDKKLIDKFLELYPEGINKNTFSKEILGMESANYPIWRDVDDKQFLMTSLEEYFGFKDLYEEDPAKTEVNTAAINSLLSQKQSCVQGWMTLGAQRRACNRLEDKTTCAFTKRRIPGTSGWEVHDIMGMIADYTGGNWAGGDIERGEELAIKGCNTLFSDSPNPPESSLNDDQVHSLKNNIINVATYVDRGYRYGFIVAAMETRIPKKPIEDSSKAELLFNFFTKKTEKNQRDEVLVVAFKLPDIGTNKGPGASFGHEEWDDPLDLSRLVLTNSDDHEVHEEARGDKRDDVFAAVEAAALGEQTENSRIYCYGGIFPNGGGTNSCMYPLPKALTDFINGGVEDCETEAEYVSFITDLAGLKDPDDTYGKLFQEKDGGKVLANLFLGSPYNQGGLTPDHSEITPNKPTIETIWTIEEPGPWPPKIGGSVVHFYLVYPMGFELSAVEEALKGAFFTKDQIAEMNEDESIVDVFEVTGQTQALNGGSIGWTFNDYEKQAKGECDYYYFPETTIKNYNNPKPCPEHPNIGIEQDGAKIDILGGRISWWLRKIQISLSARYSLAHMYYQSCQTMEEFLLGKCGGGVIGGPIDPAEVEPVAQCIEGGPRITSGETAEHINIIGTGVCAGKPTMTYSPPIHSIPNWTNGSDPAPKCDETFYSYVACTYPNTLIANPVNSEGEFVSDGDMTACEFVVKKAKELKISPRLALAMWGEETGFSHYRSSNGALGIHPGVAEPLHMGQQLEALAGTIYHWYPNYQLFLEKYSDEVPGSNQFCTNPEFPARLATYYDYLRP